ncbi:MAG: T9SS type A sorting domain-containing protein [Prevotella sp.]|nr:T9SS type A sorting domain-containing protein [Prevotella sp.]MDD7272445.1 T9SS type A sorting domain-containing protein [Prevotellaceae bacterium]MDY3935203.1 T9SS type A sorting domain-containing protein [Prevotella sp.]MDY4218759.1 T9SS type A sorting domain-containing protein [Prevotella sp.]
MKRRLLSIALTALAALGSSEAFAQEATLTITPSNGDNTSEYPLKSIRRIEFGTFGMLIVGEEFKAEPLWKLSAIKTIQFVGLTNKIDKPKSNTAAQLKIYQEGNFLYLSGLSAMEKANVAIFDLSGQIVLQTKVAEKEAIDATNMKAGVYIIKANNTTLKFIKQ